MGGKHHEDTERGHELPAAAHRSRDRAARLQPDRGGERRCYTSQSGVSKHIKDLEDELGVELFVRRGKRLLGLTDPGKEMVEIVERILVDTANIKRLGEQFSNREQGQLVIATTHTQARYVLPHVVAAFRRAFPKVRLTLHQGSPTEIASMLSDGDADIGICTETLRDVPAARRHSRSTPGITAWSCPRDTLLEKAQPLTLEAIAEWPIITYHEGFTGRGTSTDASPEAGLAPDIVMSAHGYRCAQGLRRAGPRRRHHRRHGVRSEARSETPADRHARICSATNTSHASPCATAAICATMHTASSSCARRHCQRAGCAA